MGTQACQYGIGSVCAGPKCSSTSIGTPFSTNKEPVPIFHQFPLDFPHSNSRISENSYAASFSFVDYCFPPLTSPTPVNQGLPRSEAVALTDLCKALTYGPAGGMDLWNNCSDSANACTLGWMGVYCMSSGADVTVTGLYFPPLLSVPSHSSFLFPLFRYATVIRSWPQSNLYGTLPSSIGNLANLTTLCDFSPNLLPFLLLMLSEDLFCVPSFPFHYIFVSSLMRILGTSKATLSQVTFLLPSPSCPSSLFCTLCGSDLIRACYPSLSLSLSFLNLSSSN